MSKNIKSFTNTNLQTTFKTSVFVGNNSVGENCRIYNSYIENAIIEDGVEIINSVVKNCRICNNCKVGPFSHIRDNAVIGDSCRIGNFVEIKNSIIKNETKVAHLSYIGDADIGENCNIGCGVIFCNYDGFEKKRSKVGNRVFIGSNCNIVAPAYIDDEAYIACGTTIDTNIKKGEFGIGRSRVEIKNFVNPYLKNFTFENQYFGTDGIRGIYGEFLTTDLVRKVARSLCVNKPPKIMLGTDTRPSGKILADAFVNEVVKYGGEVYELGIIPTACVAFHTALFNCDYGVMITASHNPKEYNGIKILDKNGIKLSEKQENHLEKLFKVKNLKKTDGKIIDLSTEKNKYFTAIKNYNKSSLEDLRIVLDCANGASSKIAPLIFKGLNADVIAMHTKGEINDNCGCLYPENIKFLTEKYHADLGFAFDGDADRIIAINHKGQILNGDEILYILTWYYKKNNLLKSNRVVGTVLTNLGIENKIKALGVELIRTPVGDKYIIEEMQKNGYELGGEQSGHIIFNDLIPSGDGVLTARVLSHIFLENKNIFSTVKDNKYIQIQKDVSLQSLNQKQIIKSKEFINLFNFYKNKIGDSGRLIIRASGTEPKIRIMVETDEPNTALVYALEIKKKLIKMLRKSLNIF